MSPCNFRIVRDLDPAAVIRLYSQADWWAPGDVAEAVTPLLHGSFRVAAAFDGERLVGMARALSDGASDAYIQDVVVDPAYRKQGIGGALVRILLEELKKCGVSWIGLIGAPGPEHFYRELGFSPMEGFLPMRFTGDQQEE